MEKMKKKKTLPLNYLGLGLQNTMIQSFNS